MGSVDGVSESPRLRASNRRDYFLTIPHQFAIPLLSLSVILHWLLSQSFFLARVDVNSAKPFVDTPPAVINTVGYSLGALLIFFIVGIVVVLLVVFFGSFMKLGSPMPVVAGCSMAISAACHPLNEPEDIALMPLKWGLVDEINYRQDKDHDGNAFRHCSFSAQEVASPVDLPRVAKRSMWSPSDLPTKTPSTDGTGLKTVAQFA